MVSTSVGHSFERISSAKRVPAFRESSSRRNHFGGENVFCFPFPLSFSFAKFNARTLLFVFLHIVLIWFIALMMVFSRDFVSRLFSSSAGCSSQKERDYLKPPVCRDVSHLFPEKRNFYRNTLSSSTVEGERPSLPLLLFFAGVEGSGHKFFEQVFRHLTQINASFATFEPDLHLTFEKNQKLHDKYKKCPPLPYARAPLDYSSEIEKRLNESKQDVYVRARDSFPLGRSRTPLARPDLLSLLQWDGVLYNLKVMFLLRSLPDTVRSAYRMGYHAGDVGMQARIVEDGMMVLESMIRILPCRKYVTMELDRVLREPKMAAETLSSFLDLNVSASNVMEAIHSANSSKPSHQTSYPMFGQTTLADFFDERADLLWPILNACSRVPSFFPQKPEDWPDET